MRSFARGDDIVCKAKFESADIPPYTIHEGTFGTIIDFDHLVDVYTIQIKHSNIKIFVTYPMMSQLWEHVIMKKKETVPITRALKDWYKFVQPYIGRE